MNKNASPSTLEPLGPSAVEELLRAGKALGTVIIPPVGYQPHILRPEGYVLDPVPLANLRPLPDHIRQRVELLDAESFVAYVKAFRTSTGRLFCTPIELEALGKGSNGGAKFTALLDYHATVVDEVYQAAMTATASLLAQTAARRVAHVATYPVPLSLEFTRWLGQSGKGMTQMDFVKFIEDNCVDVVSPDSATLMEMALNFEAKSNVSFQSKVDRVTGGRKLCFQETVEAGAPEVGQMKVPEKLNLLLPVFEGDKAYPLEARMEYRPSNGKLTITYHLQRPHQVFRTAWQELRGEIAEALEMEVLTGSALIKEGWDLVG